MGSSLNNKPPKMEILTLSHSHRANHLLTHFHNSVEPLLDAQWKTAKQDPLRHFKPSYTPSSVNFSPRALLWELRGGYGALGAYEYVDEPVEYEGEVIAQKRLEKSAYQRALDAGDELPELNVENTSYWSDYSRVIYEPKSFNVLEDWEFSTEYPLGRLTMGKEQQFKGFTVGVAEWRKVGQDYMEDRYRVSLEECDQIQGLNVLCELDSAWGGFTSEMLKDLKDDYSPKTAVVTWALYTDVPLKEQVERIRTFVELQQHSSVIVPLKQMDESWWINGALQSIPYESFQSVAGSHKGVNFNTLCDSITGGSNRHMVNQTSAISGQKSWEYNDLFAEGHLFTETTLKRGEPTDKLTQNQREYIIDTPLARPDSFPKILSEDPTVAFTTSSGTRAGLLKMRKQVDRFVRGDDREELIDELETLAERYVHGWEDDSDEGDY